MRFIPEIPHQTVEVLAAKVGPGATATGAVSAAASGAYVWTEQGVQSAQTVADAGMTIGEWGIVVGMITALSGVVIQLYFGWHRQEREKQYHEARMRWIKDQHIDPSDQEGAL